MHSHQTGLLIIRAWAEQGSEQPLRAHVRVTSNVAHGIERTLTLSDADEVRELVDTWLRAVTHPDVPGQDAPGTDAPGPCAPSPDGVDGLDPE